MAPHMIQSRLASGDPPLAGRGLRCSFFRLPWSASTSASHRESAPGSGSPSRNRFSPISFTESHASFDTAESSISRLRNSPRPRSGRIR